MSEQDLINMKLHDEVITEYGWRILRVFKGWLYYNLPYDAAPVFVPETLNVYTKEG